MQDYREIEGDIRDACYAYKNATENQRNAFNRLHRGKNIITPNTMGIYQRNKGDLVIEITWGRGMCDRPMYGVTIIERIDEKLNLYRRSDRSQAFHDLVEMTDFINNLS